ncbi:MAG: VOC family protein [Acidobacteriales bacterium]|nr:VOC family protein [Terriglobales bacterium]
MKITFAIMGLLSLSGVLLAQLSAPNASGVSMGHVHVRTQDIATHEKFWNILLETTPVTHGPLQVYRFKDGLLLLQKADSSGASEGSVVNHFAVEVRDMGATLKKLKAAGFDMPTPKPGAAGVFIYGPGGVKVEVMHNPALKANAASHHIHFCQADTVAMQKWYAKTFGGKPAMRNKFEAVEMPGVNLTFTDFKAGSAPTRGRTLDHIGFEVKNLEAFCKKLEAAGVKFDVPYKRVDSLNISLAFLTDPWGTYIELTDGLNRW